MDEGSSAAPFKVLGRYALHEVIAAGGMATVHFGRLLGPVGFARTVAIKCLHEKFARDPEFASMFLDEARLAARIRHPNVVQTLDVVALQGELFLVMEYVQGESLSRLFSHAFQEGNAPIPIPILRTILAGALHGLHAAHEATNERGEPLSIIHRDVSPQNILVGVDGVPRVLDFGVAKATGRVHQTADGVLKGKLSYMAPEQLRRRGVTRAADVFACGVVLWEGLANRRLFKASSDAKVVAMVLGGVSEPPSKYRPEVPPELDAVVLKALAAEPGARFATAREMARAIEKLGPLVPASEIGEWVEQLAGRTLAARASALAKIESSPSDTVTLPDETPTARPPPPAAPSASAQEPAAPEAPPAADLTQTMSSTSAATPRGRRAYAIAGGLALLAVAGSALGLVSRGPAPAEPEVAATHTPLASASTDAPSLALPPPTMAQPAASPEAAVPAPPEGASASPAASKPAAPAHPKKAVVAPAAHGDRSCDPPYVVDENGTRRYKRECL